MWEKKMKNTPCFLFHTPYVNVNGSDRYHSVVAWLVSQESAFLDLYNYLSVVLSIVTIRFMSRGLTMVCLGHLNLVGILR